MLVGFLHAHVLGFVTEIAQDQDDPEDRAEQDELLPEGVEPAEVEVERGDEISGVTFADPHPVQDAGIDARAVAEARQPGEADHEHGRQSGDRNSEQGQPGAPAHTRSCCSRSRSWFC